VYEWLKNDVKLDEQQASIFRDRQIKGSMLLTFTKEELVRPPYNLSDDLASKLIKRIEDLRSIAGNWIKI
jgi:hypothetical protein